MPDSEGAQASEGRLGGRSPVRIEVRAGRDVVAAFSGLAEAVSEHTAASVTADVTVAASTRASNYLANTGPRPDSALPDVVVLSVADDLDAWDGDPNGGAAAATEWREAMRAVCAHEKSMGIRVFVCNASTVVPDDHTSNYHGIDEPVATLANRFDAALIELSIDEGISIIDVDGIVARLGAEEHVDGAVSYSETVLDAIRADVVEVLDEYGFFHPRPLLPQRGRRSA